MPPLTSAPFNFYNLVSLCGFLGAFRFLVVKTSPAPPFITTSKLAGFLARVYQENQLIAILVLKQLGYLV